MIPAWLGDPRANSAARLLLVCFPFSGGGAAFYRPWIAELGPHIAVLPVQLPGREERFEQPAFTTMPALQAALRAELEPLLAGRPYAVFGHSMGAFAGYEFARAAAVPPVHLFVSGQRAPHVPAPHPPMHALPRPELIERLRRLGGTPQAVLDSAELMDAFTPLLRADLAVGETYAAPAPLPPAPCPLTALCGRDDPLATVAGVRAWAAAAPSAFAFHEFAGGHFFLAAERSGVLRIVRETLAG